MNKRTRTPTNAIWLAAAGAFILGLPYLWNYAAYAAVTSIATIGLYIAYVTPTFLRLRRGDELPARALAPGPVELRRSAWIAVTWVAIITILFMLPQVGPITLTHLQLRDVRRARGDRLRRHLLAGVGP